MPLCACGAPIVCTLCEACPEHCQRKDPIACGREAVEWSTEHLGPDDPRTERAREQLEEARIGMMAKDAAEQARAAVMESRKRSGRAPKPGQRSN